jgi:hypothetical protein
MAGDVETRTVDIECVRFRDQETDRGRDAARDGSEIGRRSERAEK